MSDSIEYCDECEANVMCHLERKCIRADCRLLHDTPCSTYLPEMVVIRKDWIYAAQSAIESGIESALEELRVHERDLGRTTPKNRRAAENMECEIQKMRAAKNQLNDFTFSHHISE